MFSSMKVGTRLGIAFGLVVVLLGAVLTVGVNRLALINEGMRTITQENNVEIAHAIALRATIYDTSLIVRNMMLDTDAAKIAKETEAARKNLDTFESHLGILNKMFTTIARTTATEKELMANIEKAWQEVRPIYAHTIELGSQMKPKDAYKYYFVDADGSNKNIALRLTTQK